MWPQHRPEECAPRGKRLTSVLRSELQAKSVIRNPRGHDTHLYINDVKCLRVMQMQRLLRLRRLSDWSPVIVVAALSSDALHLSLILATALSLGNMTADLLFKLGGYIKVRLPLARSLLIVQVMCCSCLMRAGCSQHRHWA